ncbi:MAG: BglG family transcription antiterminator [Streptococcaceae bacterium]|jgi:transcriptional antiterminator|nr:BglG family transcription antiterminator [Streptococcaceae bacterium]MCH4176786.1 BglG family transcription antiterminator [Streptococcaceae bacterium]
MTLERREQEIVDILLKNDVITISKIASIMHLSNKTISQSLKSINQYFEGSDVVLIRKPKVGISLLGNKNDILKKISLNDHRIVPSNKDERVQYLCFEIIKKSDYFTRQDLQDVLYVGKTTLEKDMNQVNEIFKLFNVTIEWIPGKGSFLNLMEQEKRKLAVDLIYYFWGYNWQVVKTEELFTHTIKGIPEFAKSVVNLNWLSQIDSLLQSYLLQTKQKMSDMNYHSLLLHLLIAVERIKDGKYINEIETNNDVEIEPKIIPLIEALELAFDFQLPISEIRLIQIHLMLDNQQLSGLSKKTNEARIKQMIKDTILDYDDSALNNLVSHIKSVIERISSGLPVVNPFIKDVKQSFPISFEEAIQLSQKLEESFDLIIPEDEVAFLAVHIQAFKERKKEDNEYRIKVLLVCSSGKGTSQLLAARIRREYPRIEISRILSIQELIETQVTEDLILSTVNLMMKNQSIIYVSPVLSQSDQKAINQFLEIKNQSSTRNHEFSRLINSKLIFLDKSFDTYELALNFIGKQLSDGGFASSQVIESAIDREKLSFTSIGKFATPHGNPKFIKKSTIVFLRLKKEIKWGNDKVRYIFFICIKDETPEQLELIYDNLLEIIDLGDSGCLAKGNKKQLLSYLKEGS